MKRMLLRLSALSTVCVLGLIAIAEAQRSGDPSESAPDCLPPRATAHDPYMSTSDPSRGVQVQVSDEQPQRFQPDTSRVVSDERPARDFSENPIRRTSGISELPPPESSRSVTPGNRFGEPAAPAQLPADDLAGDTPTMKKPPLRSSEPLYSGNPFQAASAPRETAVALNDRDPRDSARDAAPEPSDRAPALFAPAAPANSLAPNNEPPARLEADTRFDPRSKSEAPPRNEPAGTVSVMRHSDSSNALRPLTNDTPLAPPASAEGRPGLRQLEGAQSPHLTIEKIAPAEVQVGKSAHFEIRVRNAGTVAAQGVEIHDEIPKGTQLVSTNPAATQGPHGELIWSLGTLKPGDQTVAQLELIPLTEGEVGSVASVTFRADASAHTIVTKPQLTMQIVAPKQVMIGENALLSIKISNPGTGVATGVVLSERVPKGLQHPAGDQLEFEVGTLKPGETRQVDLTMKATQAGKMANLLTAHGEGNLRADQRADFDVVAPALTVAMTGPSRRFLERQATYTVSVSNPGTAPAKDIQLTTQLPKGLKFVKANNSGHFDPSTNTVSWSLEELPATETGSVTLVALPIEAGEQKMTTRGAARQGLTDEKEQTVIVEGLSAITFTVQASDETIELGGETTYQIHVVNQGSKAASNVQIAVVLPPELKATQADGPSKDSVQDHQVQFEPLPQLGPKAEATFHVRAQALQAGDLRVKVQLLDDDMRQPITKEEGTRVYADQ